MKIASALACLLSILLGCILFVGCASTPEIQEIDDSKESATNLVVNATASSVAASINIVDATTNTNATTGIEKKSPGESKLVPVEKKESDVYIQPRDNPRPWDFTLFENCKIVQIDGADVYVYNVPQNKKKKNDLIPHFIDQTKTIDVIFNAHTCPVVSNRPPRVFIDPGHGGTDPGAVSKDQKTYEKTVTLDIAKRLQTYLSGAGFSTMLSRTDNRTSLSLEERATMANNWDADIFISVHINSSKVSSPNGLETYILANVGQLSTSMDASSMSKSDWDFVNERFSGNKNDERNLLLGFSIHRRLLKTSRIKDRGLRRARFSVLRNAAMPAVLVECGYLSSPKDSKLLYTADFRERCARGIYQGVCDYMYGRMQPGLAATPVPTKNTQQVAPTQSNNFTPERLVKVMEYNPPPPQQPVWTPNYPEDSPEESKELAAVRENALKNAGIIFSSKENSVTPTNPPPKSIQK